MLFAVTGLLGCPVEGRDGRVGKVKDFLFDDRNWKIRWMAVDTGDWLPGRRILIHPSAIAPLDLSMPPDRRLPMMSGAEMPVVSVGLTKQQIEASPEAREDEPLSQQMQDRVYDHYGWDLIGATPISAPTPSIRCRSRSGPTPRRVRRRQWEPPWAATRIRTCAASPR